MREEFGGRSRDDAHVQHAPGGEATSDKVEPTNRLSPAAKIAGKPKATRKRKAKADGSGEATSDTLTSMARMSPAATILLLMELQARRVACIKGQVRLNNARLALVRRALGWRGDMPEKEREATRKQAQAIVAMVLNGGEDQRRRDAHLESVLAAVSSFIVATERALEPFDAMRDETEKAMKKAARSLPVYAWAKEIKGLGDLGLAVIVGEAGDLAAYANPAKLWKRLGLAVINGERQRKKTAPDEAALHGYNPHRRAEMYAVVGEPLLRAQWRGGKDGEPGHALGPYGEAYARKKAEYLAREGWTAAHADAAARRYMTKCLLRDLWEAWGRAPIILVEPTVGLPPAPQSP
ncbi:MAG: hypothetical protein IRY96_03290 [Burkholderiales bacterium]|nr:hypothetical protein [Burkholderiales bacterium]